jgi:hypothetical protein
MLAPFHDRPSQFGVLDGGSYQSTTPASTRRKRRKRGCRWNDRMKRVVAAVIASAIAACATTQPTNSPGPYPENYEALVNDWLRTSLYDPYSVRDLSITEPRQGRAWRGLLVGGPFNAWATCVTYNAKNRMGGYVGLSTTVVWIVNGAIVGSEPYDSGAGIYPLGRGPHSEYSCA